MFINLGGLPGKVLAIYNKLVSDLDVKVSTRAPASTALSTNEWSNARAEKLDNLDDLDAPISAIPTTGIKSLQSGTFYAAQMNETGIEKIDSVYIDVTISSVDTSKSLVFVTGSVCKYFDNPSTGLVTSGSKESYFVYAKFINQTTLRLFSSYEPGANRAYLTAQWKVVEFN